MKNPFDPFDPFDKNILLTNLEYINNKGLNINIISNNEPVQIHELTIHISANTHNYLLQGMDAFSSVMGNIKHLKETYHIPLKTIFTIQMPENDNISTQNILMEYYTFMTKGIERVEILVLPHEEYIKDITIIKKNLSYTYLKRDTLKIQIYENLNEPSITHVIIGVRPITNILHILLDNNLIMEIQQGKHIQEVIKIIQNTRTNLISCEIPDTLPEIHTLVSYEYLATTDKLNLVFNPHLKLLWINYTLITFAPLNESEYKTIIFQKNPKILYLNNLIVKIERIGMITKIRISLK